MSIKLCPSLLTSIGVVYLVYLATSLSRDNNVLNEKMLLWPLSIGIPRDHACSGSPLSNDPMSEKYKTVIHMCNMRFSPYSRELRLPSRKCRHWSHEFSLCLVFIAFDNDDKSHQHNGYNSGRFPLSVFLNRSFRFDLILWFQYQRLYGLSCSSNIIYPNIDRTH